MKASKKERPKPLRVSGVGNGSQECEFDCALPIAMKQMKGTVTKAQFHSPAIVKSDLPALLGLDTLTKRNVVIDFRTRTLYLCGPGGCDLASAMPPGRILFS